jgi:hypothetical protein
MTLQTETPHAQSHETLSAREQEQILDQLTDQDLRDGERRALVDYLVTATPEQRAEATLLGIDHVAQICRARIVERDEPNGDHSIYFATRNTQGANARLDDIYRLTQSPDGTTTFQVDFMRGGDSGYRITGDKDGNVSAQVLMQSYKKGISSGSESEHRFFLDYMDRSLKTARIMKERWQKNPSAAEAADVQSKEMLEAYLDAYSDVR